MNNIDILMMAGTRRLDLDKATEVDLENTAKRMEMIIGNCGDTIKFIVAELEKRGYSSEQIFRITNGTH